MSIIKKLSKIGYSLFIGFIILIAGVLIFSMFPIEGNFQIKIVLSGSMEPAIHVGSLAIVKPEAEYNIGDIITFNINRRAKVPTTHRIFDIEVNQGEISYITKGDANEDPDTRYISEDDIMGKVIFTVPLAGYALDFVKKPIGFVIVIILPALAIIADEIKKVVVEFKKIKKDKQLPKNQDNKEDDDKKDL